MTFFELKIFDQMQLRRAGSCIDRHTTGDFIKAVFSIHSPMEALDFYRGYCIWLEENGQDPDTKRDPGRVACSNIGWCFGEGMDPKDIEMWSKACGASHPIFGDSKPTPEAAFKAGQDLGEQMKLREELQDADRCIKSQNGSINELGGMLAERNTRIGELMKEVEKLKAEAKAQNDLAAEYDREACTYFMELVKIQGNWRRYKALETQVRIFLQKFDAAVPWKDVLDTIRDIMAELDPEPERTPETTGDRATNQEILRLKMENTRLSNALWRAENERKLLLEVAEAVRVARNNEVEPEMRTGFKRSHAFVRGDAWEMLLALFERWNTAKEDAS